MKLRFGRLTLAGSLGLNPVQQAPGPRTLQHDYRLDLDRDVLRFVIGRVDLERPGRRAGIGERETTIPVGRGLQSLVERDERTGDRLSPVVDDGAVQPAGVIRRPQRRE